MNNERNLEINITDDNNFFVTNSVVANIKYRLKEEPYKVSNEEMELLKRVEKRKDLCKESNIHYFVLPNPSTSDGAYCHWCDLRADTYSFIERTRNKS